MKKQQGNVIYSIKLDIVELADRKRTRCSVPFCDPKYIAECLSYIQLLREFATELDIKEMENGAANKPSVH